MKYKKSHINCIMFGTFPLLTQCIILLL